MSSNVTINERDDNELFQGETLLYTNDESGDADESESGVDTGFNPLFVGVHMPQRTRMAVERIDDAMAHQLLVHNVYKDQRHFKPKRLEELVRKMQDAPHPRYHGSDIAIANLGYDYPFTDKEGNQQTTRKLLINGQHTLKSIIMTKIPQEVVVKEFAVKSPNNLLCLYAQFDAPGGNRTALDIAQTYKGPIPKKGCHSEQVKIK